MKPERSTIKFAGFEPLLQAVSDVKKDFAGLLGFRCGRIKRDGTGDERKAEEAFPVGAGGHDTQNSGMRTIRTQDERATLVPTPYDPSIGSFFAVSTFHRLDSRVLGMFSLPMTDRPASWRMSTPKQMEKLAAAVNKRSKLTPSIAWKINGLACRSASGPHAD